MELHRARGTVSIIEGRNPRTGKPITRIARFEQVVVKGSTEAEWRASFKYHREFSGDKRLKVMKLEDEGKVDLLTIESVCRLGI